MINEINSLITSLTSTAQQAIVLVAIVAIGATFFKTRALVPTLVVGLTAGVALFLVFNPTKIRDKVGEDLDKEELGAPATVTYDHTGEQLQRAVGVDGPVMMYDLTTMTREQLHHGVDVAGPVVVFVGAS